jgi:hypothetical protein
MPVRAPGLVRTADCCEVGALVAVIRRSSSTAIDDDAPEAGCPVAENLEILRRYPYAAGLISTINVRYG